MFELDAASARAPRISVEWLDRGHEMALSEPHGHHFLTLMYFERGGGTQRVGARTWEVSAGDLYLLAPGELHDASGIGSAAGWLVGFSTDVIAPSSDPGTFLAWHANPLLYPFARPTGGEVARFGVPEEARPEWSRRLGEMNAELRAKAPGYQEALRAHLTLLLVEVARLARDVVGQLHVQQEPVLASVFEFIEENYAKPISLRDVARSARLSSGYLTTLVRRRTGRTVLEWIAERRMAEARRLLVETEESVERVGARVGYDDPTYFIRRFRALHGATPASWRNTNS